MLKIALMGDLHYPALAADDQALVEARDQFFAAYFKHFFNMDADYHISIGDISHLGLAEEFDAIHQYASNSNKSFRFVLGNHDILAYPKSELPNYTKQPRYDKLETSEAVMLLLDTTKEMELHGWGIDVEQWEWLKVQIEQSGGKNLLIFAHHPVPGTTGSSPRTDALFEEYQDIRPILKLRQGTAFYFNGHTHTHSIATKDNWHYIQTAAAICHPSLRLIEITESQVQVKTIVLDDKPITGSGKYLYDHLKSFHRPKDALFMEFDLHHIVNIMK